MKRLVALLIALTMVFTVISISGIASAAEKERAKVVTINGEKYIVPTCCKIEMEGLEIGESEFLNLDENSYLDKGGG